jgi:hypothetical protein
MIRIFAYVFFLSLSGHLLADETDMTFMVSVPEDFSPPTAESEFDRNLLKNIDTVGWHNVHVAEENGKSGFSFSVGHFHNMDHPEILVIGLPEEVSHQLLNIAAVKIVGAKEKLEPYKEYSDLTESLSIAFVPVDFSHYAEYLGYAGWYYGSMPKPFPTIQMVWPDRSGLFPWDEGYDVGYLAIQPVLGPSNGAAD